jgi:hypothetical protein
LLAAPVIKLEHYQECIYKAEIQLKYDSSVLCRLFNLAATLRKLSHSVYCSVSKANQQSVVVKLLRLAIPRSQQYLVETLSAVRANFLVGKLTTDAAMQKIEHTAADY